MINSKSILNDRYQLEQKISEFSNRQTWRATDLKAEIEIHRQVIIKVLVFSPQTNWEQLKLFQREASVLKNIDHHRIPNYLDSFSLEANSHHEFPSLVLVQELIFGASLRDVLARKRNFSAQDVQLYAEELLQILIYLHELSPPILHRDIKPSNVIWGEDKHLYLVDFGAVQDKAKAEGATFTVVGTSGYTPPEQLWGKAVPSSDLYALGATLIHLLTGKSPAELPQRNMRIQFGDQVSLSRPFSLWLEGLVNPAPEHRFSNARAALVALQGCKETRTFTANLKQQKAPAKKEKPNYVVLVLTFLIGFLLPIYLMNNLIKSSKKPSQTRPIPTKIQRNR